MPYRLIDEYDVAFGDGDIVLVTGNVGLSFTDVLKFNLVMPVPVYNGSVGRGAVDGRELYGIAAEQEYLSAFCVEVRLHICILSQL